VSCRDVCRERGYDDGIEYGIARRYVETRRWGLWETFREFVQNALDEMHEVRGARPREYPCKVEYKGYTPVTVIADEGRGLSIHHLLLGTSEKKAWQRGRFGEGLKLALLASAHRGIGVLIRSGDKEIVPTFVTRVIEGVPVDVFCVCYKSGLPAVRGTRVEIRGHRLCDEYRDRFVQGLPTECFKFTFEAAEWYDIIDKRCTNHKPYVYVRDIYVATMYDAEGKPAGFSYNLFNVTIDESRRIPSGGSVREEIRYLWHLVAWRASQGDARAYEVLKEALSFIVKNCRPGHGPDIPVEVDMDTFKHIHDKEAEAVREAFEELYGEDTIFIQDEELRKFAEYVGAKYIYCPQPVGYSLEIILKATEKLRRYMEKKVKGVVRKEDMPPKLRQAVEILEELARTLFDLAPEVVKVQYAMLEEDFHAMSDMQTRTITLNLWHLDRHCRRYWESCVPWYISAFGHELAHIYSRANDGTVEFERALTEIMGIATTKAILESTKIAELVRQLDQVLRS
jgi:hypothetical protein